MSLPSIHTSTTHSNRPIWTSSYALHNQHHSSTKRSTESNTNHLSLPPLLAISPKITNPTRSQPMHRTDPILLNDESKNAHASTTSDSDKMTSRRIQLLSMIYLASQALNLPLTISAMLKESNFNLEANASNHSSLAKLLNSRSFDSAIVLVNSIITHNDKIALPLVHYIQFLSIMHIYGRSHNTNNHRASLHAAQEALHLIRDANLRKYIHLRLSEAPPSSGADTEVTLLIDQFWDYLRAHVLGVPLNTTDTIFWSAIHVAAQYFMDSVTLLKTVLPSDPNSWSTILIQDKLNRHSQLYPHLSTSSTIIHPSQQTTQPNLKNRVDSAIQRENATSRHPPIATKSKFRNSLSPAEFTNQSHNATQSVQSRRYSSVLDSHKHGLHDASSQDNADGLFNLNEFPPALDFQWDSPVSPPHWTHAHHVEISTDVTLGPFPGTVCAMAVADYQGSLLIALAMDLASTSKNYASQQGRRILVIHSGRTVSRLSPPSSKATVTYTRFLGNTEPHSSWLLASDTDANITMWHWPSGQRFVWRKWHRRVVYQVIAFPGRSDSHDRAVLVSCGADHAIRIWGVASCPPVELSKSSYIPTANKDLKCSGGGGIQAGPASIHSNAPFVALCFVGSTTESQVLIAAQTYSLRVYKARTLTLIHTFQLDYHKHNRLPVCSLHLVPTPYTTEFSAPIPGTHASLSIPVSLTETESNSLTFSGDCGPALIISSDAGAHLRLFYLNKNAYSRTYAARELDLPRTVSGMQPCARKVSVSPCGTLVGAPGHPHDRPILIWRTRSGRFVLKGFLERMHDRNSIMGPVSWYTADTLISTVMDHANGQRSETTACTTVYIWRVVDPALSESL